MNMLQRWKYLHLLAAAGAAVASLSCAGDSAAPDRRAAPSDASRVISDGAHGGNSDVFFLPPMVDNPNKAPGYGDPFQGGLPVVFKIRDLTAAGQPVITTLTTDGSNGQFYQANWDTKSPALNPSHTYRIEVGINSRTPAFADVDVVANGSQLKNVNTQEFIGLQDGRTLPIKVRVEKGWACVNKASCAADVVQNSIPAGKKVVLTTNDQMNAISLAGNWNDGTATVPVILSVEDVTGQQGSLEGKCAKGVTKMLTKEHCIKFTADPPITLTAPVTVATCLANPGDKRQLVLKYDVGETPKYLEDVAPPIVCPEATGSLTRSSNPLVRLAAAAMSRVGKAVGWATGVRPAYAIDLGVGGRLESGDNFSYFSLGLPSEFEALAGQSQTALINTSLPVDVKVRLDALHHHGDDPLYVTDANLTCAIVGASGALIVGYTAVASAPATNNGDGTYTCPHWRMPGTAATNTLRISSDKHDATFLFPDETGYRTVAGTIDFTATSVLPLGVINNVNLTSSTLVIGGDAVPFTANITNPGISLTGVFLQGDIVQGPATRASGGGPDVNCGGPGIFAPGGPCSTGFTANASNTASGTGVLAPGAASFRLKLIHGPTGMVLDSNYTPVTLFSSPVASISLAPAGAALDVGLTVTLVPTVVLNAPGSSAVTWASSNAALATVSVSGVVTAVASGNANVTATAVADATKTAAAPIAVYAPGGAIHISTLTITNTSLLLPSNPSGTWSATLTNTTGYTASSLILQGTIVQGANSHAAGGVALSCAVGGCSQSFAYSTEIGGSVGPLVAGPASLKVELLQGPTVLDTKLIPITLVAP